MAQACERCSRPNVDAARACLYCGAALDPRLPPPHGRRTNPHHLVVVPSADAGADAERLVALLSIAPYEARMIVRAGGPRAVRTVGDASAAEELLLRARALGLRALRVDEYTLATVPPVDDVVRVGLDGGLPVLHTSCGSFPRSEERRVG